uniref:hypothetical protein n=1 Tax=Saccharothrix sp. NRRL B-16314 TaxID=1463825 RepID=UPI00068D94B8
AVDTAAVDTAAVDTAAVDTAAVDTAAVDTAAADTAAAAATDADAVALDATVDIDERWRAEMLAAIESDDAGVANPALLELTYDDPDGEWVEPVLLDHLDPKYDLDLRRLAVTCLGHLARIHGKITRSTVVPTLRALLPDPVLGGTAEDALGDIDHFAPAPPAPVPPLPTTDD